MFENISLEGIGDSRVTLPLSGGLDSRSQAVALRKCRNIKAYSYGFVDGFGEQGYGAQIAKTMGWDLKSYAIPRAYLWDRIDQLAKINECYSEFTHPRQMAIFDEFEGMGDLFHLAIGEMCFLIIWGFQTTFPMLTSWKSLLITL